MKRAWWQGSGEQLAAALPDAILGALTRQLSFPVESTQTAAWLFEIRHLQAFAAAIPRAHIFLEFAIPRMGRRADAIILLDGLIFVLEYKVGATEFARHAIEQVHGYALDLKSFHETSHDHTIIPVLIATGASAQDITLGLIPADRVAAPLCISADDLVPAVRQTAAAVGGIQLNPEAWMVGAYRPTPTIIEAAQALFRGHAVTEISRSEAGAENLTRTADAIMDIIDACKRDSKKGVIFVTGVPGAGKTLAGLSIAAGRMGQQEDATFLSGNGPLVDVLREALRRDLKRRKQSPDPGDPEARHIEGRSPGKFIQNVHHFRDEYLLPAQIPSEHVVIFDEAQRAWNQAQTSRFMRDKRGLAEFNQSEPQFLLSVMARQSAWCTVICLIGEGQEINTGEAGLGEWIRALDADLLRSWKVFAPPHLLAEESALDRAERWKLESRLTGCIPALHLAVSIRSFRAERVSEFVALLLGKDAVRARESLLSLDRYPLVRTRSLATARAWLRERRRGTERAGLVAASSSLRLKPEGLHVKAKIDVPHWFLDPPNDLRASDMLEDTATEFDVQGLELDWVGVCWDLNLRRIGDDWCPMGFRAPRWHNVRIPEDQRYIRNSYRVLLTRARQGMVIFVPRGDKNDATRPPEDYQMIDDWLAECGIPAI